MASPSTVLTRGYGSWGGVSTIVTLGYGTETVPAGTEPGGTFEGHDPGVVFTNRSDPGVVFTAHDPGITFTKRGGDS